MGMKQLRQLAGLGPRFDDWRLDELVYDGHLPGMVKDKKAKGKKAPPKKKEPEKDEPEEPEDDDTLQEPVSDKEPEEPEPKAKKAPVKKEPPKKKDEPEEPESDEPLDKEPQDKPKAKSKGKSKDKKKVLLEPEDDEPGDPVGQQHWDPARKLQARAMKLASTSKVLYDSLCELTEKPMRPRQKRALKKAKEACREAVQANRKAFSCIGEFGATVLESREGMAELRRLSGIGPRASWWEEE